MLVLEVGEADHAPLAQREHTAEPAEEDQRLEEHACGVCVCALRGASWGRPGCAWGLYGARVLSKAQSLETNRRNGRRDDGAGRERVRWVRWVRWVMWRQREFRPEAHRTAGPEINPPMAMAIPANEHRSARRTCVRGSSMNCAAQEGRRVWTGPGGGGCGGRCEPDWRHRCGS